MLDLKLIRENPERARKGIKDRGGKYLPALEETVRLEEERRRLLMDVENMRKKRNESSAQVGHLKAKNQDAAVLIKEMEEVKSFLKEREETLRTLEEKLNLSLLGLPNIPEATCPVGRGPEENRLVREFGEKPNFDFEPLDHTALGEKLGILDFSRAAKMSGSRFVVMKGKGARLERALINFMMDLHAGEHGYTEIFPPFLVSRESMTATGQLPRFEEELYKCEGEDVFLIPTAEVPLTNLHREDILEEGKLPLSYCAHTACFRREAGSYGKDTRGLIRQHQFNKVELVRISRPEDSMNELEKMTSHAEEVLKRLRLPYHVMELCTGDLGFGSAKTYDLEVWMPGEKRWREISSSSNFTDFQARRMGLRAKRKNGKNEFAHTLNASGLAVGRTLAAILENFQKKDGSVAMPPVLVPYLGFSEIPCGR